MIDDLQLFVRIVEAGGLAEAARRAGLPPATVTRRLQRLEERLGARLIHRSARRFALTSEGEAYFSALAPQFAQLDQTLRGLSTELTEMRGPLRVTAPSNISLGILRPMWIDFAAKFPEVELDLRLSNRNVDMLESGADLALRIGPQSDPRLYQIRLGVARTVLVAAPEYIAEQGAPQSPEELAKHRLMVTGLIHSWALRHDDGRDARPDVQASMILDDIGLVAALVAEGLGVALLPVSEIGGMLRDGRLIRVLQGWRGVDRELFAVWPTGRLLSARARALRDHMAAAIAAEPVLRGEIPS